MSTTGKITNPIFGENPFKLGLFCWSHEGGNAMTTAPERWKVDWDNIAKLAKMADASGFDFMLPLSGWHGWKGEESQRRSSFEPLTIAAALSGITKRIGLFSTIATPFNHPLPLAKMLMTIDHASHGRAGLNIVCAWGDHESKMFGTELVGKDRRYDHAQEWYDLVQRYLSPEWGDFDYEGEYFKAEDTFNYPKAYQPRIPIFNAGVSAAGRDYAIKNADFLLAAVPELEKGRKEIATFKARAEEMGQPGRGVVGAAAVVCRKDRQEAIDYNEYYSVERADNKALDMFLAARRASSQMPDFGPRERQMFAGGANVAGTPQDVADYFIAMHEAGYSGAGMTLINYLDELPLIVNEVLPILEKAGIRLPASSLAI